MHVFQTSVDSCFVITAVTSALLYTNDGQFCLSVLLVAPGKQFSNKSESCADKLRVINGALHNWVLIKVRPLLIVSFFRHEWFWMPISVYLTIDILQITLKAGWMQYWWRRHFQFLRLYFCRIYFLLISQFFVIVKYRAVKWNRKFNILFIYTLVFVSRQSDRRQNCDRGTRTSAKQAKCAEIKFPLLDAPDKVL